MTRLSMALLCAALAGAFAGVADAAETPAWSDEATELDLEIGGTRSLSAEGVRNFTEGVRGIADIKLTTDGKQFIISGREAGTTSLLLIRNDGSTRTWTINVFPRDPAVVRAELERLLDETPGLRLRRVGSRFFIEGGVGSEAEAKRLERIAALYPGQVESLVTVGVGAADRGANIRVDFYFVQYDRSSGWRAGLGWPAAFGVGATLDGGYDLTTGVVTAQGTVSQALPSLDLAAASGRAKILRQSTVITANGSAARFESGGEENFRIEGQLSSTIQAIPFGASVTVLPRLDLESGTIDLSVKAEIADLAEPQSGSDLPSRSLSKLDTAVRVKLGEAFVLSGIQLRSERAGRAGLPLLSDIPVLGLLFGRHHAEEKELEGAIFVIPTATETVPRPAEELVKTALREYAAFDGDLDEVAPLDALPPPRPAPPPGRERRAP